MTPLSFCIVIITGERFRLAEMPLLCVGAGVSAGGSIEESPAMQDRALHFFVSVLAIKSSRFM